MSKYGAQRVSREVGGKVCHFRSKLEYRYAVYLQLQKEQGYIKDWEYEPLHMAIEFQHGRYGNTRKYLPDFAVLTNDDVSEVHETKGMFNPIDYTKLKKYSEMHGNPIVLIFANLKNTKSSRAQYNRAKRLKPHIYRIIWQANKDIFKNICFLFDE